MGLKTKNPKPKAISKEDWATLEKNYKVSSSIPEGVMKNGVEVTITTEPRDHSVIDAFHDKYGCNIAEKKSTHNYKTDGFTENITNGSEFKSVKGDVLDEMKRVCVEETNVEAYYPEDVRAVSTYFLCPTPQKDNYSNAKIVIVTRANEGIFDTRDYVYIFSGPFGSNYKKDAVNASWAEAMIGKLKDYDLKREVIDELTDYDETLEWKYEWQEMD